MIWLCDALCTFSESCEEGTVRTCEDIRRLSVSLCRLRRVCKLCSTALTPTATAGLLHFAAHFRICSACEAHLAQMNFDVPCVVLVWRMLMFLGACSCLDPSVYVNTLHTLMRRSCRSHLRWTRSTRSWQLGTKQTLNGQDKNWRIDDKVDDT